MTGERIPLAFATLVHRGGDFWIKSFSSNIMWSVAPESSSQAPRSLSREELTSAEPKLPKSESLSWENSVGGINDR